jgi:hypothetical protein
MGSDPSQLRDGDSMLRKRDRADGSLQEIEAPRESYASASREDRGASPKVCSMKASIEPNDAVVESVLEPGSLEMSV